MEIEIIHNPLVLPIRKLFKLSNIVSYSKDVEAAFDKWIDAKDPDYRVRYVFDHDDKTVELSARNSMNVLIAEKAFKTLGVKLKQIPFKPNKTLLKIRDKRYKGI